MRSRRRFPLPVLLVFGLVAGMGLIGVAYTYWTKTLTVNGSVETGNLDSEWVASNCDEFVGWPLLYPQPGTQLGEFAGQNVGAVTTAFDAFDPALLHITITNGYPNYAVTCNVDYFNSGSIPFVPRGRGIQPVSGNLTNCNLTTTTQESTLSCDQLTVKYRATIGAPVPPLDALTNRIFIHVENGAAQGATYEFTAKVCVAQFNANPTPSQCDPLTPNP